MNRRNLDSLILVAMVIALVVAAAACSDDEAEDTDDASGAVTVPEASPDDTEATIGDTTTTRTPARGVDDAGGTPTSTGAPSTTSSTAVTDTTVAASSTTSTTTPATSTTTTTVAATTTTIPEGPRSYVRIGADHYPFTPDECVVYDGIDAVVNGDGATPDGTPIYVDLAINELRVDIGTTSWVAGSDLEVALDVFEVTATSTFVSGTGLPATEGELVAECG